MYAAHGDVLRLQGMNHPERRVEQGDVFDEDALTLGEVDQLRTQAVLLSEGALLRGVTFCIGHRHTILTILQQSWTGLVLLGNHTGLPSEALSTAPRPPSLLRTATINGTLARDGNVGLLEGIDARRQVVAVQSFPRGLNDGVELGLEDEFQNGTFLYDQIHVALQVDGTRLESHACRNDDASATFLRAFVNSLLDSLLVVGSAVARLGAILGNQHRGLANLWLLDALLNLPVLLLVPSDGHTHSGHQQAEQCDD